MTAAMRRLFGADSRFAIVGTAPDGTQFLKLASILQFDVGVVGWDMPHGNGRTILAALRDLPEAPPVVIYTGNADSTIPRETMALGTPRRSCRRPEATGITFLKDAQSCSKNSPVSGLIGVRSSRSVS